MFIYYGYSCSGILKYYWGYCSDYSLLLDSIFKVNSGPSECLWIIPGTYND